VHQSASGGHNRAGLGAAKAAIRTLSAPILALLAFGVLLAIPSVAAPYFIVLATLILMYVILAVSWTVFCAPSQYFSLGIAAFFGVGIYTYAILVAESPDLPVPALLVLAGVASSVLAFFVGLTTLRLRGMYFAIFTFGLAELLRHFVMWWEVNETGTVGRWIPIVEDISVYRYMSGLAILTVLAAYLFRRSRYGLALRTIGDAESAAEHIGINVTSLKIIVFAATCFFTGAAGALISTRWTYIDADFAFDPIRNMFAIMMALFGGLDLLIGPILGAVSIGVISDVFLTRLPQVSRLLLGLLLVIVVLFMPQGLVGLFSGRVWRPIRKRFTGNPPEKSLDAPGG
jgi:branched-chain amino acid transport system permease protein